MTKPILCLDFDGVLHSYTSGWVEADFIPDPPVPGAMEFLCEAIKHFDVKIFSSRSHQDNGIRAMATWVRFWAKKQLTNDEPDYKANAVINTFYHRQEPWPKVKPPAMLTIDDRALAFDGTWPSMAELKEFQPWNKRAIKPSLRGGTNDDRLKRAMQQISDGLEKHMLELHVDVLGDVSVKKRLPIL